MIANFDFTDPKHWLALLVGLLLIAVGGIPLLNSWGLIDFNIPESLLGIIGSIALWVISAAGFYLLIDAFFEDEGIQKMTFLIAFVVLAIGIIPLLYQFGIIAFTIPFLSPVLYYAVFVVEGIFLVIASFTMLL